MLLHPYCRIGVLAKLTNFQQLAVNKSNMDNLNGFKNTGGGGGSVIFAKNVFVCHSMAHF